jgi:hypothetical protein
MTKHDLWFHLRRFWGRYTTASAVMAAIVLWLTYGSTAVSATDNFAEKYINAKVDARMNCVLERQSSVEAKLEDMTRELKTNNEYMHEIIKAYIQKGIKG